MFDYDEHFQKLLRGPSAHVQYSLTLDAQLIRLCGLFDFDEKNIFHLTLSK